MVPYPPPYTTQSKTGESQILRSLGAILALLGMLLAVLGIIFHQSVATLVFALLIAIFSLRTFILWLGDTQRNHNQKPKPFMPPQSAPRNFQALARPYPPQPGYFVPPQPTFVTGETNQATVPFAPANFPVMPPGSAAGPMPPSVRPQAQGFFYGQAQGMPPGSFAPPPQSFVPGYPLPPASIPMQQPLQPPAAWSYVPSPAAPGQPMLPTPSTPPASPTALPQPGQSVESWQKGQGQQPPQEGRK